MHIIAARPKKVDKYRVLAECKSVEWIARSWEEILASCTA